ncbi:hypothetical protein ACKGJN_11375 [Gillisia sp. Q332]|uniref:hypothetical protein n=1 Tax=Gillisia xinjiangensis TaxID=3384765 RepID=UPI00391BEBB4
MKKNIFKEEFNWLSRHLPEALIQTPGQGNYENVIQSIIQELQNNQEFANDLIEVNRLPIHVPEITRWESNEVSFESLFETLLEMYNSSEGSISMETLSALTEDLGREAFGMYLPMHYYFQSRKNPWGVYLFPEAIFQWAKNLYQVKGKSLGLSLRQVELAFTYAVFRHELFHHQVECFSTKQEVLNHKVNYNAYGDNVNGPCSKSEDWLEEALAEATVLNSKHVYHNTKIKAPIFRKLYEFDLKRMPAGYRDYHCRKFGGPEKAHKLFASQIAQCKINPIPAPATKMCTVSANEFSNSWKKVPIYMVNFKKPKSIKSPREIFNYN